VAVSREVVNLARRSGESTDISLHFLDHIRKNGRRDVWYAVKGLPSVPRRVRGGRGRGKAAV
jgi:hypothetical protein